MAADTDSLLKGNVKEGWFLSKWTALVASLFISLCGGSIYAFGVYSAQLKTALHLSQTQVQTLALMSNLGNYVPFLSGYIFDRYGPRVAATVGAVLNTLGYVLVWHGYTRALDGSPSAMNFIPYCFYFFIIGHASCWLDTASIGSSVRNFSEHRGIIVGLVKSFYGIGASVLAQLSALFFKEKPSSLLLFLGVGLGGIAATSVSFSNNLPPHALYRGGGRSDNGYTLLRLRLACVLMAVLAILLSTLSMLSSRLSLHNKQIYFFVVCGLLSLIFLLPLLSRPLAIKVGPPRSYSGADPDHTFIAKVSQRELSTWQCINTLDYWLVFGSCVAIQAGGLTAINNIAQIVESLGGKDGDQDVYVSILSAANALGRLVAGTTSDYLAHKVHRTQLLPLLVLGMGLSYFAMLWVNLPLLYVVCFFIGLFYGAQWCIMPAVVSELFGVVHFGANYSFMALGPATASFVFSTYIASSVYESHSVNETCIGRPCFFMTFVSIAIANLVGLAVSIFLAVRSREYYEGRKVRLEPVLNEEGA